MQQERRSNFQRSEATRSALLTAARRLFVAQGYADTSTPQVGAAAGVSRGALYHQFEDKRALFHAVIVAEARSVAETVDARSSANARSGLVDGARAYLAAMRAPGRCRLLLVEGPAVLGSAEMRSIDLASGARTLVIGLREAVPLARPDEIFAAADLLSAAFERAALAIEDGSQTDIYESAAINLLLAVVARLEKSHGDGGHNG